MSELAIPQIGTLLGVCIGFVGGVWAPTVTGATDMGLLTGVPAGLLVTLVIAELVVAYRRNQQTEGPT